VRIGVLARLTGMTASRVRFYEARGLLPRPPRRQSGYRDYDEQALGVLKLIARAQGLGYTLREIALYLSTPSAEDRRTMLLRCIDGKVNEYDHLLTETQTRLSSLQQLRQELA